MENRQKISTLVYRLSVSLKATINQLPVTSY